MDSSISLEGYDPEGYVLGKTPTVPVNKLDMVKVLEGVIAKLKPLLKYLPCFKPLSTLLNGGILPGCATRRTDTALVKFPKGISERTKAVEIQVLEEADVETTSTRKSLLLTDDGEVLVWSAVYARPIGDDELCRFTLGRDEVAKESRFEIFDGKKLREESTRTYAWKVDWKEVILKIFNRLSREMEECIEEREKYLQNMRYGLDRLDVTIQRIQSPL